MLIKIRPCVLANLVKRASLTRNFSTSNTGDDVVIVAAGRTPIGSFRGQFAALTAPQMASNVIKYLVNHLGLAPDQIDEVILGNVISAGSGQAPTRQAALLAGLPTSVITTTVNKVCASGMKSIMFATQSLLLKHQEIIIAGGMESMSNVPYYLKRGNANYGHTQLADGILYDGLTDAFLHIHMGNCGENTANNLKITRQDQDNYAVHSYKRAQKAAADGIFKKEIVPIQVSSKKETVDINEDEEYKKFDESKFTKLKSVFMKDGTITAANASKLNDGAAACLLMTASTAAKLHVKPIARIVTFADNAVDPIDFPIANADAMRKCLNKVGLKVEDIDRWEINEAFSVVPLANAKLLNIDPAKLNVHGGAVSLGHPIGMSGARIVNSLAFHLQPGKLGMASICNGGGGASSILIEKL